MVGRLVNWTALWRYGLWLNRDTSPAFISIDSAEPQKTGQDRCYPCRDSNPEYPGYKLERYRYTSLLATDGLLLPYFQNVCKKWSLVFLFDDTKLSISGQILLGLASVRQVSLRAFQGGCHILSCSWKTMSLTIIQTFSECVRFSCVDHLRPVSCSYGSGNVMPIAYEC
jgi:hypothetical protein